MRNSGGNRPPCPTGVSLFRDVAVCDVGAASRPIDAESAKVVGIADTTYKMQGASFNMIADELG